MEPGKLVLALQVSALELIPCTDGNYPDAITLEMCVDRRKRVGAEKMHVYAIQLFLRADCIQASNPMSPHFSGKTHPHQEILIKVNYVDFPCVIFFDFYTAQ